MDKSSAHLLMGAFAVVLFAIGGFTGLTTAPYYAWHPRLMSAGLFFLTLALLF